VNEFQQGDNMPGVPADDFRWDDLDQRLLFPKISDLAEEMQKRVAEGERKVAYETQQSGNAAGYLTRLFAFHEQLTDEWAERLYNAHCETWVQQNRTVSATFIRAVRDRAITQLIDVRKASVHAEVRRRGTAIGNQPNPIALGDWNRRMDRLAARWNRKLEADAVESNYRAAGEDARRWEAEAEKKAKADSAGVRVAEIENKPIDRWLSLFALAVAVALYLLPRTELVIIGCCVLIWGSLIRPFVNFWWIEDLKWRQLLAVIVLTGGVVGLGLNIKPEKPHANEARDGSETSPALLATRPENTPSATARAPGTEPFSVDVRSAFVSDSGPLTKFMVAYPSMFGSTTSPVLYLAYIQLTNLQDVPTAVSDFKIAASKEAEGPWEDLVPIPLPSTTLYTLGVPTPYPKNLVLGHGTYRLATAPTKGDMALAAVVDASPKLASEIAKLIQPHDTIYGWIALDSLRHVGLSPGQIYFRIKARDAANKTGTYIVELPRKVLGDSSMDVNCGVIAISGVKANISGFHVKYYSDPYPTQ
jgi:hypothetical protein